LAELVEFTKIFLDLSWQWLNDAEIKQTTNTPDFTKESQQIWYNNLKNKTDYKIWGIEQNGLPIGACGLKNITDVDCEYWGYLGKRTYWGKGIGTEILKMMEGKARSLKLESIWLQVLRINERAIRLYNKNGYLIETSGSNLLIMRKSL